MPFFIDQLNRTIELKKTPSRIISLVPSQTELLYDLGLEEEVVGITKFCVHPESWFRNKTRIGGTKTVNIEKVKSLRPDLIIANKEENNREQIEDLAKEIPVWISNVNTLGEAGNMITTIGEITGKTKAANDITDRLKAGFKNLSMEISHQHKKTCYLIWKDPFMTVGGDTFINDLLTKTGFENMFQQRQRYPQITIDELQRSNCQLLLLSSEPYPFQQKHINELQQYLPATKIILVDGEMFSWYGSRLLQAIAYFKNLHRQIGLMV